MGTEDQRGFAVVICAMERNGQVVVCVKYHDIRFMETGFLGPKLRRCWRGIEQSHQSSEPPGRVITRMHNAVHARWNEIRIFMQRMGEWERGAVESHACRNKSVILKTLRTPGNVVQLPCRILRVGSAIASSQNSSSGSFHLSPAGYQCETRRAGGKLWYVDCICPLARCHPVSGEKLLTGFFSCFLPRFFRPDFPGRDTAELPGQLRVLRQGIEHLLQLCMRLTRRRICLQSL